MPETRLTEFPALSVDHRVEISWRFLGLHRSPMFDYIIFLTYDIKNCHLFLPFVSFFFFFDILRCISNFSERHSVFFAVVQK